MIHIKAFGHYSVLFTSSDLEAANRAHFFTLLLFLANVSL